MKSSLIRNLRKAVTLLLFAAGLQLSAAFEETKSSQIQTNNEEILTSVSGLDGISLGDVLKNLDASADTIEYAGDNVIIRGHAVVSSPELKIYADSAIINLQSRDIEAVGNVMFSRKATIQKAVDEEEYAALLDDVRKSVKVLSYFTMPSGRRKMRVSITETTAFMRADRVTGNLMTGAMKFQDFAIKSGSLYAAASEAQREPGGKIKVRNARVTTCDYIMDDHDHYAFTASSAIISPRNMNRGLRNYAPDQSEHDVLLVNPVVRFWDIPLLWFPALYKPMETDSFGVDLALGSSSDWGFWLRMNKSFTLYDDPFVNVGIMADYYSRRGWGLGVTGSVVTGFSKTDIFLYGMRDSKPYELWDFNGSDEDYSHQLRFKIPKERYDFKITNLTHITSRLDFRGQFEKISDMAFLEDYFNARYKENPQPPTYAALEYQFDWASAAVWTNIKVNYFDSVVERLPEGRLDFQRQELFAGLYYQGETSAGYYRNNWRDYDYGRAGVQNLKNYSSGRFDTLHMFYYPFMLDFLNVVPRAGVRFTAYSSTAENSVSDDELLNMFYANSLESGLNPAVSFQNFEEGDAKVRFMGEFGVELNTKIYRSWQNVRSSWFQLDGLRHVLVPYVNYTYIPKPTLDYEDILYFDEVDRLREENFVRVGAVNRLQTRTGDYGMESVREWASLETYWDFHAIRQDGCNNIGDLGIKISLTPLEGLSLTSDILIDVGDNNDGHTVEATRANGREAGYPGLMALKFINKWDTTLKYKISKDWEVNFSYIYSDYYRTRSVYSMGSFLDTLNATSTTIRSAATMGQEIRASLKFPTYIDPKMTGEIFASYDVNEALMKTAGFRLVRNFHCFNVGLECGRTLDLDGDGDKETRFYIGGYVNLSAMPSNGFNSKFQ